MHTSTAYFAGAGTVVIAVVVGIGGGVLIADMMNPKTPGLEMAKLERRTASQSQSAPVSSGSYLAATGAAATTPVVVAPAPANAPVQPQPPAEQTQPPSVAANAAAPQQPARTASAVPSASSVPAQTNAPEAAFAKARDSDLKARDSDLKGSDGDLKRSAAERRHVERRQWAERRRIQRPRDPDLREVEQAVRDDTAPRAYVVGPVGMDTPRFRLFDGD